MSKEVKVGGRPTKFDKKQMLLIEYMTKDGKTDKEIAEQLEVTERTYHNWKKTQDGFFHALKDWKKEADLKVERALYERACGYSTKETKLFCHEGMIIAEDINKNYPPDPTSMIFWLKNRQPDKWRDKVESEISGGSVTVKITKEDSLL